MGYRSTMSNFEHFPFQLSAGIAEQELRALLDAEDPDYWSELTHWFNIAIDSEGYLSLRFRGEADKDYYLTPALNSLIKTLAPLQSASDDSGLSGFRCNFELWGEDPGDATLYRSYGEELLSSPGKMTFPDELTPVHPS